MDSDENGKFEKKKEKTKMHRKEEAFNQTKWCLVSNISFFLLLSLFFSQFEKRNLNFKKERKGNLIYRLLTEFEFGLRPSASGRTQDLLHSFSYTDLQLGK